MTASCNYQERLEENKQETLIRIEGKLDTLIKTSENRITKCETLIETKLKDDAECTSSEVCAVFKKNMKSAVGFLYAVVLAVIGALIYGKTSG